MSVCYIAQIRDGGIQVDYSRVDLDLEERRGELLAFLPKDYGFKSETGFWHVLEYDSFALWCLSDSEVPPLKLLGAAGDVVQGDGRIEDQLAEVVQKYGDLNLMQRVQDGVGTLQNNLEHSINEMLRREDNIQSLTQQTEELEGSAQAFRRTAIRQRRYAGFADFFQTHLFKFVGVLLLLLLLMLIYRFLSRIFLVVWVIEPDYRSNDFTVSGYTEIFLI